MFTGGQSLHARVPLQRCRLLLSGKNAQHPIQAVRSLQSIDSDSTPELPWSLFPYGVQRLLPSLPLTDERAFSRPKYNSQTSIQQ